MNLIVLLMAIINSVMILPHTGVLMDFYQAFYLFLLLSLICLVLLCMCVVIVVSLCKVSFNYLSCWLCLLSAAPSSVCIGVEHITHNEYINHPI